MTQVLQVFIFQDGQFLGTEMATGDRIEIGRDPSCGIHLDDESCSRKHALLFFHDGQLAIQDLGSANGTLLNKQVITGPRLVSSRDEVGIGRYQIKLKTVETQLPRPADADLDGPPPTQALISNPARTPAAANVGRPAGQHTDAAIALPGMASFSSEEGDPTIVDPHGTISPLAPAGRGGLTANRPPQGFSLESDPTMTAGAGLHSRSDSMSPLSSSSGPVASAPPSVGALLDDLTLPPEASAPLDGRTLQPAAPVNPAAAMNPAAQRQPPASVPMPGQNGVDDFVDLNAPPTGASMIPPVSSGPSRASPPPVPEVSGPTSSAPSPLPAGFSTSSATSAGAGRAMPPVPMSDGGLADRLEPSGDNPVALLDPGASAEALPVVNWVPGNYEPVQDEEPDDVAPGWSLVQRIVRAIEPEPEEKVPAVEVIHYRGEQVIDQATLLEGESFPFGRTLSKEDLETRGFKKPTDVVTHRSGNVGEVVLLQGVSGRVLRNGQQVDLLSLPEAKAGKIPLTDGDLASLEVGGDRLFIRFSRAVNLPRMAAYEAELKRERRRQGFAAAAAILFVLVGGITSWIYQYRALKETVIQLEDDGFADVKKELELEFKEPTPKPKPKKIEVPAPPKEETKVALKPEPQVAKESDVGGKKEAPKKPGVLDALKNLPPENAGAQSLTKALSNVKGVKVPGASGFKVSALSAKGVKGVSIGGASGGVDTSSLNNILRAGGGGNGPGTLAGRSTKAVKGQVKTLKRESVLKGQGSLSREEIQKVVRALVGKIQYCYEKQLRTNAGLAGKVVLEWTIQPNGRVGVVKTGRGTSLKSAAAISCMQQKLKGAQFPKPKGGSVIVTYPFIFNTL